MRAAAPLLACHPHSHCILMCWGGCSEPGWLSLQSAKEGVQAGTGRCPSAKAQVLVILSDLLGDTKPVGSESVWEELFGILISFTLI